MCSHHKSQGQIQSIDLGFLFLLYRAKVKILNLTQPHFLTLRYNEFEKLEFENHDFISGYHNS